MSTTTPNDGGPAFPIMESEIITVHQGMSLRDYFAAKAMQAIVGTYSTTETEEGTTYSNPNRDACLDPNHVTGSHDGADEIASDAYTIADAMLKARGK